MLTIGNYVKAKTLEEAYELNQARNSRVMGGMMWMRLGNARVKINGLTKFGNLWMQLIAGFLLLNVMLTNHS